MPLPHTRARLALAQALPASDFASFFNGMRRASAVAMKCLCCLALLVATSLFAWGGEVSWNVNSRYTVESAEIQSDIPVSRSLRHEIHRLVGARLNPSAVAKLTARLTEELKGKRIRSRLERGTQDGRLKLVWDVLPDAPDSPASRSVLQYAANPGFSAVVETSQALGPNSVTFTMGRDSERTIESASGMSARFERTLGDTGVKLNITTGDYRQEWLPPTAAATSLRDQYSARRFFDQSVEWQIGDSWTLSAGTSVQHLQHAGFADASNALTAGLAYHHLWIGEMLTRQEFQVAYAARLGSQLLDSDYAYRRHQVEARYSWKGFRHAVEARALWGEIHGQAPLYERFILGNSEMLRGWSKYDVAPAGGDRVAYASVEAGYQQWRLFYDAGQVHTPGARSRLRQSAGAGIKTGPITLSMAVPLHDGIMIPVLIASLRF